MRVFHGVNEIAGNIARITKHLRLNGIDVTSMNWGTTGPNAPQCDINVDLAEFPYEERRNVANKWAKWAIEENFDIYHFHFPINGTLLPSFSDLKTLHDAGKKIVVSLWGSDQRSDAWIVYNQAKYCGYDPPKPHYLTIDHIECHDAIHRYADCILGFECIPRGLNWYGMIDESDWTLAQKTAILAGEHIKKDLDTVYFVHAPSSNWKKGSKLIFDGIEAAKNAGLPVEMFYVYNKPREEAKKIYAFADYCIDQVGVGLGGLFSLECMLWRLPVLAYMTPLGRILQGHPPIMRITKETFVYDIRQCVELFFSGEYIDRQTFVRNWVLENALISDKIHDLVRIYNDLMSGKRILQYDNFPRWKDEADKVIHCARNEKSKYRSEFYRYLLEHNIFQELGWDVDDIPPEKYIDKRYYVVSEE